LQQLIDRNKEEIKDLKKDMARSQKGSMKDGKKLGSDKRESSKESKDRSGLISKLPSDMSKIYLMGLNEAHSC
jgi:hypothetical protein